MDAPLPSTSARPSPVQIDDAELEALRRRAYGRNADISTDPDALARLAELESAARAARRATSEVPREADEPVAAQAPVETTSASVAPVPADTASGPEEDRAEPADPDPDVDAASGAGARVREWISRGRRPWAVAAIAGVVALVGVTGWAIESTSGPRPAATFDQSLAQAPGDTAFPYIDDGYARYLGVYGADASWRGSLGALQVWTMVGESGIRCLHVSLDEGLYSTGCAGELDPQVEIYSDPRTVVRDAIVDDLPRGSLLRFVWSGDRVELFIDPRPEAPPDNA